MPDGDRNRDGVAKHFKTACKQACEGNVTLDMIARSLVKGLRVYGNSPGRLLKRFAGSIRDEIEAAGGYAYLDVQCCSQQAELLAVEMMGNKRGVALAMDACREWLQIEKDDISHNWELELCRIYITRMYLADFTDSLPLMVLHRDADPREVEALLSRLQSEVENLINRIAVDFQKQNDVAKLRKPRSAKQKIDPLEDDLMGNFGG